MENQMLWRSLKKVLLLGCLLTEQPGRLLTWIVGNVGTRFWQSKDCVKLSNIIDIARKIEIRWTLMTILWAKKKRHFFPHSCQNPLPQKYWMEPMIVQDGRNSTYSIRKYIISNIQCIYCFKLISLVSWCIVLHFLPNVFNKLFPMQILAGVIMDALVPMDLHNICRRELLF